EHLAGIDVEKDAVDRLHNALLGAEGDAQLFNREEVVRHRPVSRIRGSSSAKITSVTALSTTTKNAPSITITITGGTSSCAIDSAAYWPTPWRLKTDSVRIAPPPITAAKSSDHSETIGISELRRTCRSSTRRSEMPFARAVRT